MLKVIEVVLYMLIFGLLIIGVIQDIRTRNVRRGVSIPFGIIAIVLLIFYENYWIAGFTFLALYMPRNGVGQLILIIASILLIMNLGVIVALPLIVGILFFDLMGRMGWYGLGDLAIVFPLVGLCHDWYIFAWICGLIVIAHFYLNFKRYNSLRVFSRTMDVMKMIWNGQPVDDQAIKTPALVIVAMGVFGYFFIFPGYFLNRLITSFMIQ